LSPATSPNSCRGTQRKIGKANGALAGQCDIAARLWSEVVHSDESVSMPALHGSLASCIPGRSLRLRPSPTSRSSSGLRASDQGRRQHRRRGDREPVNPAPARPQSIQASPILRGKSARRASGALVLVRRTDAVDPRIPRCLPRRRTRCPCSARHLDLAAPWSPSRNVATGGRASPELGVEKSW